MLDILLLNGKYPDFERGAIRSSNIGIKNKYIAYMGFDKPNARHVIDCRGKIISPGFVDIHMHEEDFDREGKHFSISNMMLEMGVTTACGGNCGHSRQPLSDFKRTIMDLGGSPINYLMQSGYNSLRTRDGLGPYEESTEEQRIRYRELLKEELDEGSIGISFGLEYDPAISYDEMLFAVSASDDPSHLVSAHYRTDCIRNLDPIREMIRLSRDIKQRFQISHLSSCAAFGNMKEALDLINDAMQQDAGLNYDTYPYNAFSCSIGSAVFDDGCLNDWAKDYSDIMLTADPYKNQFCTEEMFYTARRDHPEMLAVAFVMEEEDIRLAIINKKGMIASDGLLKNSNGHPRAAGTFPRVLGKYVREEKALSLLDALRKITKEPADRLLLLNKGQIKPGFDADITVFDPEIIIDKADYGHLEKPIGIDYVLIGGEIAVENGETVNRRLGRFLKFGHDTQDFPV